MVAVTAMNLRQGIACMLAGCTCTSDSPFPFMCVECVCSLTLHVDAHSHSIDMHSRQQNYHVRRDAA